jgi:hypothetical protein
MRENFLKTRRFAPLDASLFSVGGGHLSLIPLPSPLARTPRGIHLSERHPPSSTYKTARTDTSPALTCQAVIASPVGAKQSSCEKADLYNISTQEM